MTPARWTAWYWPAALAFSITTFVLWHDHNTALAAGAVVLGVPEVSSLARRRWVDTFSDWCWRVIHVIKNQPVSQWTAEHFLALAGYVALAVRVDWVLWLDGYWPGALGTGFSLWLTWHLFGRQWT